MLLLKFCISEKHEKAVFLDRVCERFSRSSVLLVWILEVVLSELSKSGRGTKKKCMRSRRDVWQLADGSHAVLTNTRRVDLFQGRCPASKA